MCIYICVCVCVFNYASVIILRRSHWRRSSPAFSETPSGSSARESPRRYPRPKSPRWYRLKRPMLTPKWERATLAVGGANQRV